MPSSRKVALAIAAATLIVGSNTAQASDPVQFDSTSLTAAFGFYALGTPGVTVQCAVFASTKAESNNLTGPRVFGTGWLSCGGPGDTEKIITDSNVSVLLANLTTGTGEWSPATQCANAPTPGNCNASVGPLTCDANSSGYCGDHFRTRTTAIVTTNQDIDPSTLSDGCELLNSKTMQCIARNGGIVV